MRKIAIPVLTTPELKTLFSAKAKAAGLPLSTFMVQAALVHVGQPDNSEQQIQTLQADLALVKKDLADLRKTVFFKTN